MYFDNFDFLGDFAAWFGIAGWRGVDPDRASSVDDDGCRFNVDSFTASERVFNVALNTSVASISRSWPDNRAPSFSATEFNVMSLADGFDLAPRDVVARLVAVVIDSLVPLPVRRDVVLLSGSGGVFDEPRKRPWRDNTVAFEQVVVERTASFTDSTEESEGSVVTAIGGISLIRVVRWLVCRSQCRL